jgi:hypothetical protein
MWEDALIPLAMASAGWAAISAVGGALVGATAGGLVEFAVTSVRDRGLARTAARLVLADLRNADFTLRGAERSKKWNGGETIRTEGWDEYQAVLAGRLDQAEFQAVTDSIAMLRGLRGVEAVADAEMEKETAQAIGGVRDGLATAYNSLADLAEMEKAGDRITEPSALLSALERAADGSD